MVAMPTSTSLPDRESTPAAAPDAPEVQARSLSPVSQLSGSVINSSLPQSARFSVSRHFSPALQTPPVTPPFHTGDSHITSTNAAHLLGSSQAASATRQRLSLRPAHPHDVLFRPPPAVFQPRDVTTVVYESFPPPDDLVLEEAPPYVREPAEVPVGLDQETVAVEEPGNTAPNPDVSTDQPPSEVSDVAAQLLLKLAAVEMAPAVSKHLEAQNVVFSEPEQLKPTLPSGPVCFTLRRLDFSGREGSLPLGHWAAAFCVTVTVTDSRATVEQRTPIARCSDTVSWRDPMSFSPLSLPFTTEIQLLGIGDLGEYFVGQCRMQIRETSGPQMLRTLLQSALSERLNVAAFVEFTVDDIHTSEFPVSIVAPTSEVEPPRPASVDAYPNSPSSKFSVQPVPQVDAHAELARLADRLKQGLAKLQGPQPKPKQIPQGADVQEYEDPAEVYFGEDDEDDFNPAALFVTDSLESSTQPQVHAQSDEAASSSLFPPPCPVDHLASAMTLLAVLLEVASRSPLWAGLVYSFVVGCCYAGWAMRLCLAFLAVVLLANDPMQRYMSHIDGISPEAITKRTQGAASTLRFLPTIANVLVHRNEGLTIGLGGGLVVLIITETVPIFLLWLPVIATVACLLTPIPLSELKSDPHVRVKPLLVLLTWCMLTCPLDHAAMAGGVVLYLTAFTCFPHARRYPGHHVASELAHFCTLGLGDLKTRHTD
jgi:hypothetical protein